MWNFRNKQDILSVLKLTRHSERKTKTVFQKENVKWEEKKFQHFSVTDSPVHWRLWNPLAEWQQWTLTAVEFILKG